MSKTREKEKISQEEERKKCVLSVGNKLSNDVNHTCRKS